MKLLVFGDTHISGKNSVNYKSNYLDDCLNSLKEIISISKKSKVDFILCGGDLFDSPIVSLVICDKVVDTIESAKIPFYSIVGNHDLISNNWQVSQPSTLAHIFRRSKWIKKLDEINEMDVFIKGYSYYTNIEGDIKEKGLLTKSKARVKIALVHCFLTEKKFLPTVLHIPVGEINTNYDLILASHNHTPFRKVINNTEFINLGAIGLRNISEADIRPRVVLIDTDKDSIKFISLGSAKPKEEIFDLEKVVENKKFENEINKFIASLETTKFEDISIQGMVIEIGRQNNTNKEIVNELLERINKEK